MENGGRMVCSIPHDIIFQILRELPVKTLLRFRAVSKLWCSIIDDPEFVDSHRTRSHTRPGGIRILSQYAERADLKVYSTDPEGVGSSVPFLTLPGGYNGNSSSHYDALQSVNGLVCWENTIYNRSTRERIDLPPIIINFQFDIRRGIDHNRCKVVPEYLLGFDPSTQTYKVLNICTILYRQSRTLEYRIFTLGTLKSSWRDLTPFPQSAWFNMATGLLCIDGVIFFLGCDYEELEKVTILLAFEVGPEKFRVIQVPEEAMGNVHVIQVGDHLGLVDEDFGSEGMTTIWILEDYHKQQWKKRERINNRVLRNQAIVTPMGTIHNRSQVLFCSNGHGPNRGDHIWRCFYYDLRTGKSRVVPKLTELPEEFEHPQGNQRPYFLAFTKHVECLFRLKGLIT